MKRILTLVLAGLLFSTACTKEKDQDEAYEAVMGAQEVSAPIQAASYDQMVTLVLDLNCIAVDHLEVKVLAGATVAAGVYTGSCQVGAVRIGNVRRL